MLALLVSAPSSSAEEPSGKEAVRLLEPLASGLAEDFDWSAEHGNIERALLNVWQDNGWNEEADLFARDVARAVSAVPPWKLKERLEVLTGKVTERYDLTPPQRAYFQRTLFRESTGYLVRNAGVLTSQSVEAFRTRSAGKPFTPDQVAEWVTESGPALEDMYETVDRMIEQFESQLMPRQKRILQRDRLSYEKRRETFADAMTEWAKGKWKPTDWGLQDDPIQTRSEPFVQPPDEVRARVRRAHDSRVNAGKPAPNQERAVRWRPHEPPTWYAYVLQTKERYCLDRGQMNTAESIHAELLERAADYTAANTDELAAVPPAERPTHPAYDPIRRMFQELQDRLGAIPTTAQREGAGGPMTPQRPADPEKN